MREPIIDFNISPVCNDLLRCLNFPCRSVGQQLLPSKIVIFTGGRSARYLLQWICLGHGIVTMVGVAVSLKFAGSVGQQAHVQLSGTRTNPTVLRHADSVATSAENIFRVKLFQVKGINGEEFDLLKPVPANLTTPLLRLTWKIKRTLRGMRYRDIRRFWGSGYKVRFRVWVYAM
ncbi:hypothetical protein BO70DRAFT_115129 [Aspergillus heteromorphus CBS 117.55]|uniref:Uncharacterized protein n=1 Tax=Aspergillus heteromorphus CBS 117.55 TaxID=1448321 RepID=A0A317VFQ0_9EURO|nr:uncharacterized protein BO70DRAFT_115129 [Aspergillus heteromorphus CBS 117.55]PWY72259.1 hypothetical protein BO70DRAFT_115129 [Aspergillus heteromorphus CBS 117.55]